MTKKVQRWEVVFNEILHCAKYCSNVAETQYQCSVGLEHMYTKVRIFSPPSLYEGTSLNYFKVYFNYIKQFSWSLFLYLGFLCLSWSIFDYLGLCQCISVNLCLSWSISVHLGQSRSISVYIHLYRSISVYFALSQII